MYIQIESIYVSLGISRHLVCLFEHHDEVLEEVSFAPVIRGEERVGSARPPSPPCPPDPGKKVEPS